MAMTTFNPAACRMTLFEALLTAARNYGWKKNILEDAERQSLTYGRLVLGSLVLGRRLAAETAPGEATGLLLPNVNALIVSLF